MHRVRYRKTKCIEITIPGLQRPWQKTHQNLYWVAVRVESLIVESRDVDLEKAAAVLDGSADYRVLRRLLENELPS
jgi:hypothetical protein